MIDQYCQARHLLIPTVTSSARLRATHILLMCLPVGALMRRNVTKERCFPLHCLSHRPLCNAICLNHMLNSILSPIPLLLRVVPWRLAPICFARILHRHRHSALESRPSCLLSFVSLNGNEDPTLPISAIELRFLGQPVFG